MKLLRLKIFQETACYLKPMAFKVGETFPLAPFSTVKGMLHAILRAKKYIPMRLSIQGKYESLMIDYQKKYMFKIKQRKIPLVPLLIGLDVEVEMNPQIVTTMPMYQHLLFNMEHIIHIEADEAVLNELYTALINNSTPLSLGRWEDVVRIDTIDFVEVEQKTLQVVHFDQYRPFEEMKFFHDVINKRDFKLPTKYEIVDGRREWDYIETILLPAHKRETPQQLLVDHDGYTVSLLG